MGRSGTEESELTYKLKTKFSPGTTEQTLLFIWILEGWSDLGRGRIRRQSLTLLHCSNCLHGAFNPFIGCSSLLRICLNTCICPPSPKPDQCWIPNSDARDRQTHTSHSLHQQENPTTSAIVMGALEHVWDWLEREQSRLPLFLIRLVLFSGEDLKRHLLHASPDDFLLAALIHSNWPNLFGSHPGGFTCRTLGSLKCRMRALKRHANF